MDDDRYLFPIQFLLDHIFALLIISILILIALKSFLPYHRMAKLTGISGGSPFLEMKLDMMLYRAHHGVWPKDNQQALRFGWSESYDQKYSRYIKRAEIDNGAIHFSLAEDLSGETVTLRPAVPAADPLGPVIWICGDKQSSSNWKIYGVDRTTVDDRYIHSSWR
jgi:type IV pilus assembly protein PilA